MRTEGLNSFTDGIIQDMYEPQTPSTAMTSALNATLLTFNDNEFCLQNDMGNAQIGTAFLPKGYVPVGMKEHGGVVYVASMNPETGKGQIGSFPSPQRIFGPEDNAFTKLELDMSSFFRKKTVASDASEALILEKDFIRKDLFQIQNSTQCKEFSPGDRFTVVAKLTDAIIDLLDKGIVTIRLYTISTKGQMIEVGDGDLRMFDNGAGHVKTWFKYYTTDTKPADLSEYVQVFSGKSPGRLSVIIEYNLFDNFIVTRQYTTTPSIDSEGKDINLINVTFKGQATGLPVGITANGSYIDGTQFKYNVVKTINGSQTPDSGYGTFLTYSEGVDGLKELKYDISPCCYYGIKNSLKKSGVLNFDDLRKNNNKITGWTQYVTDSYVTINWSYDYFDIDQSKNVKIKNMFFKFIDIEDAATQDYNQWEAYQYTVTIKRDIYSGSFEDVIGFNGQFKKGRIYLCLVGRKLASGEEQILHTAYVYNTPLFNGWDSTKFISDSNPTISTHITINATQPKTEKTKKFYISKCKKGQDTNYQETSSIQPSDLIVVGESALDSYVYNTKLQGSYKTDIEFSTQQPLLFQMDGTYYNIENYLAGYISESDVANCVSINSTSVETVDYEENVEGMYVGSIGDGKFNGTSTNTNLKVSVEGTVDRYVYGESSELYTKDASMEQILPVYDVNDPTYNNRVLLGFSEEGADTVCITANEDHCWAHSTVHANGSTTNGSQTGGSAQEGYTLACIQMGNKTINILAGTDEEDASLRAVYDWNNDLDAWRFFIAPYRQSIWHKASEEYRIIKNGHFVEGSQGGYHYYEGPAISPNHIQMSEFDANANFMIVSWKCTDGKHRLIPLASQKNANALNKKRVNETIKCILSQLLIAKRTIQTLKYKTVNTNTVTYHKTHPTKIQNTITFNHTNVGIKYGKDGTDPRSLAETINTKLGNNEIAKPVIYFPTLTTTCDTEHSYQITLADELNNTPYVDMLLNSDLIQDFSSKVSALSPEQRRKVYLGKVKYINGQTGICTLEGDPINGYAIDTEWDGRYLYDWSRSLDSNTIDSNNFDKLNLLFDLREVLTTKLNDDGGYTKPIDEGYNNELLAVYNDDWFQGKYDAKFAYVVPNKDKQESDEGRDDWYRVFGVTKHKTGPQDKVANATSWVQGIDSEGPTIMWYINFGNKSWHYYCGLYGDAYEKGDEQQNTIVYTNYLESQ